MVKSLPAMQETWVQSLGPEDPLEKGTATHSHILSWRISWTKEPGGLQSKGLQRVGHVWGLRRTNTFTFPIPPPQPYPRPLSSTNVFSDYEFDCSRYLIWWKSNCQSGSAVSPFLRTTRSRCPGFIFRDLWGMSQEISYQFYFKYQSLI